VTGARPTSGLVVSGLLRRVAAGGGNGAVLARGDATAGAILLLIADRGVIRRLVERGVMADGSDGWRPAGPASFTDPATLADYLDRRRRNDPDLWVVELDAPDDPLADPG